MPTCFNLTTFNHWRKYPLILMKFLAKQISNEFVTISGVSNFRLGALPFQISWMKRKINGENFCSLCQQSNTSSNTVNVKFSRSQFGGSEHSIPSTAGHFYICRHLVDRDAWEQSKKTEVSRAQTIIHTGTSNIETSINQIALLYSLWI